MEQLDRDLGVDVEHHNIFGLSKAEREARRKKRAARKKVEKQTANQLYKKSGTRLSFKDWIGWAKESGVLEKAIDKTLGKRKVKADEPEEDETKKPETKVRILGMPPVLVYVAGAVIVGTIGFTIYKLIKG